MIAAPLWSRILSLAGLAAMLVGALDPLEGSIIVLTGAGLLALAALLEGSRRRALFFWSFVLVGAGVGALFLLSACGGIGGGTGRSIWWGLLVLPYPLGWILGLTGAVLELVKAPRHTRASRHGAG